MRRSTTTTSNISGGRILRRDFVLNLDTLLREVEVSSTNNATTHCGGNGSGGGCCSSTDTVVATMEEVEGDERAADLRANSVTKQNNDMALNSQARHRRDVDAGNDVCGGHNGGALGEIEQRGKEGGDSGSSGRQVLSNSDRHSIKTLPLRVIDQLRLCYFQTTPSSDTPSCTEAMRIYGFECIHCNKIRKDNNIRQKKRGFRKYPKHANDVVRDLLDFRSHLNVCSSVSSDLKSYMNWMEQWCRFPKVVKSVAIPISHRLDGLRKRARGNAAATAKGLALVPAPKKLSLPLPSPQKKKRKVCEIPDRVLSTKTKRSARISSHSILENLSSLA
jgi:hypothetical protein